MPGLLVPVWRVSPKRDPNIRLRRLRTRKGPKERKREGEEASVPVRRKRSGPGRTRGRADLRGDARLDGAGRADGPEVLAPDVVEITGPDERRVCLADFAAALQAAGVERFI